VLLSSSISENENALENFREHASGETSGKTKNVVVARYSEKFGFAPNPWKTDNT
jgi:hypothetical protein